MTTAPYLIRQHMHGCDERNPKLVLLSIQKQLGNEILWKVVEKCLEDIERHFNAIAQDRPGATQAIDLLKKAHRHLENPYDFHIPLQAMTCASLILRNVRTQTPMEGPIEAKLAQKIFETIEELETSGVFA